MRRINWYFFRRKNVEVRGRGSPEECPRPPASQIARDIAAPGRRKGAARRPPRIKTARGMPGSSAPGCCSIRVEAAIQYGTNRQGLKAFSGLRPVHSVTVATFPSRPNRMSRLSRACF